MHAISKIIARHADRKGEDRSIPLSVPCVGSPARNSSLGNLDTSYPGWPERHPCRRS